MAAEDRRLLRRPALVLARVESAAVVAAHTEPRKFTQELQTAAVELRELLSLSDRAGELSQGLLREAASEAVHASTTTLTTGSDWPTPSPRECTPGTRSSSPRTASN